MRIALIVNIVFAALICVAYGFVLRADRQGIRLPDATDGALVSAASLCLAVDAALVLWGVST